MQTTGIRLLGAAALAMLFVVRDSAATQTVYSGITTNFGGAAYILGDGSSGNGLVITNQALFENMSSVTIGTGPGGDDNEAIVTGSNSRWNNNGNVTIGSESGATGNALTIQTSGAMNNDGAFAMNGAQGVFTLSGGGKMNTVNGIAIGNAVGADNNTVIVTGAGTLWQDTVGSLNMGSGSSGNFLIVSNGATLNNDFSTSAGSTLQGDNTVIVTGAGSVLRAGRSDKSQGNSNITCDSIVTDGGSFYTGYTYYYGGNVTVADPNSKFIISAQTGYWSAPITWHVSNGGYLSFLYGTVEGSGNRLVSTGPGSVLRGSASNGSFGLTKDANSYNNSIMVSNGGAILFSKEFRIGVSGCTNNVVTVAGPGSRWTHFMGRIGQVYTSRIFIGVADAYNNYLNVYDGGAVTVTNLIIAGASNALNLGSGTQGMSRASVEVGDLVLSDAGARLNMNNGMLSTTASGMLVSGNGVVSNAGPAYFSIPENRVCEISSVITGPGNLTKEGLGELTLTGANDYTGATSVSNGTLVLTQALLHDESDVYVASGSKLDLDFIGDDWIGSLYWDDQAQPRGTYAAGDLGGAIIGTGRLRVTTSIAAAGINIIVR